MLTLRAIKAILLSIMLMAGPAFAEKKYVTDLKYVNLYSKPNKNSETLMYLPSGAKVKVVYEGQQFAKVKTDEGVTGWVATGHLDPAKPELIKHLETKTVLKEAQNELKTEREKHAESVTRLQTDLTRAINAKRGSALKCPAVQQRECPSDSVSNGTTNSATANASAPTTVSSERAKPEQDEQSSPLDGALQALSNPIVLGTLGAVFILGFLLGWLFFDWRRRRRYGGFRI